MNKLKISRINETLDSLQYLYELSKSERHFIFNASKTNQEVVELLFFIGATVGEPLTRELIQDLIDMSIGTYNRSSDFVLQGVI
jgi:hypothetical protein